MPATNQSPARQKMPATPQQGRQQAPKRTRLALLPSLAVLALAGALLAGGGFAFAATQEAHDNFCASCHTEPETTYVARARAAAPVDLASAHTPKDVLCINCHSGPGVTGRMSAELMGARNAARWYSGTAVQPAPLTVPIGDANCLKCHDQVTAERSENNHFHFFLARWQQVDANAATCVSCHRAHSTDGAAGLGFLSQARTEAVCEACHNAIGERD